MAVAMSPLKNLPAGFRLNPKEEDLVEFYLNGKLHNTCGSDVVSSLIPELNIYNSKPRDLIHLFDEMSSIKSNGLECFFFCPANKNRKIADGKGFWRETGKGRKPQETDKHKWAKRIFCHDLGTQKNPQKTDWVMHEFRIIGDEMLVLCRITKKPLKKPLEKKRKSNSNSEGFMGDASNMNMIGGHTDQPTDIGVEDYSIYEMYPADSGLEISTSERFSPQ